MSDFEEHGVQRLNIKEVCRFLKPVDLMFFMFLFGTSISLENRFIENTVFRQICRYRLEIVDKQCFAIEPEHNMSDIDTEASKLLGTSSTHVFLAILLKIVCECFASCFLCSWSDVSGRKIPLFIALMGENLNILSYFFSDVPFEYFIGGFYATSAISGLFGGYVCIFTMSYCYLTDSYTAEYRILLFTMIDFMFMSGIIIGITVFDRVFLKHWHNILFVDVSAILSVRCILIIWMLLTFRDRKFDLENEKLLKKIRMLFSLSHVQKTWEAITSKRKNCHTEQLILMVCSTVPAMVIYSLIEGVVLASALHARLFPSFKKYVEMTLYLAIYTVFVEVLAIIALNCLANWSDSLLGVVGFLNLYLDSFFKAFSFDYHAFLSGLVLTPLKGFAVVSLRSSYSKIPGEDERGRLFFVYSVSEIFSISLGYFIYQQQRPVLGVRDHILPHMVFATAVILVLSTFTFQIMSIETDQLLRHCYGRVQNSPQWPRSQPDIRQTTSAEEST